MYFCFVFSLFRVWQEGKSIRVSENMQGEQQKIYNINYWWSDLKRARLVKFYEGLDFTSSIRFSSVERWVSVQG